MEATVDQLSEFGKIGIFLILGALFVMIAYGISYLLSKNNPSPGKLSTYECGEEPEGTARIQFNNRFYVIALVFLLFDVEIVFLFPWSAVFAQQAITAQVPVWGWLTFGEMILFVCVLLVGLVYVWMKGDLAWIRPKAIIPATDTPIPVSMYEAINAEKYTVREFRLPAAAPTRPAVASGTVPATASGAAAKPATPRFKPGMARPKPAADAPVDTQTPPASAAKPATPRFKPGMARPRPAVVPSGETEKSETPPKAENPKPATPRFKPRLAQSKPQTSPEAPKPETRNPAEGE